MIRVLITILAIISSLLVIQGCAGTGFEKKCTLIPDSIGIETENRPKENLRFDNVRFKANWNLK